MFGVCMCVQWSWNGPTIPEEGYFVPYDYDQNGQLEAAFAAGRPTAELVGDLAGVKNGATYIVRLQVLRVCWIL